MIIGRAHIRADRLAEIIRNHRGDNLAADVAESIARDGWRDDMPAGLRVSPGRAPRPAGEGGAHRLAWMVANGRGADAVPVDIYG